MGKTYRNVDALSDSVSVFGSPHNRGYAKTKKRHSRHSIRNKNRDANEETIQTKSKHIKVNEFMGKKNIDKIGNIPNMSSLNLDNTLENIGGANYGGRSAFNRWTKEDGNIKETINKAIDKIGSNTNHCRPCYAHHQERYLNATQKQIERRGKASLFRGHREK